MIVTYEGYKRLGYGMIPEPSFVPVMWDAQCLVQRVTFERITEENATEQNKRGLCRLAELYFQKSASAEEGASLPVSSYHNGDYSETYDTSILSAQGFSEQAWQIVSLYFTPEQLYRGVKT